VFVEIGSVGTHLQGEEKSMAPAHENHDKTSFHAREHHDGKRERNHPVEAIEQLIFTVNATTGTIIKVEKIDARGKRREIPQEETIALTDKDRLREIEVTLDEAFEAGITSVLEPNSGPDSDGSSADDSELRHALLEDIIGRGIRRRLQRRLVQRLILAKALAH
jgi:hypothetical protein